MNESLVCVRFSLLSHSAEEGWVTCIYWLIYAPVLFQGRFRLGNLHLFLVYPSFSDPGTSHGGRWQLLIESLALVPERGLHVQMNHGMLVFKQFSPNGLSDKHNKDFYVGKIKLKRRKFKKRKNMGHIKNAPY